MKFRFVSALSLCIDAVQSMLYPFVWQHTIVPVLPQSMTEIASAPTPFILGLLSKNVEDWKSIYPDQVYERKFNNVQISRVYFKINVRLIV
jgi:hypothetical protein